MDNRNQVRGRERSVAAVGGTRAADCLAEGGDRDNDNNSDAHDTSWVQVPRGAHDANRGTSAQEQDGSE